MRLPLRQQGVQIAEPALESTAFENRGSAGSAVGEIDHLAGRLHRAGDGDAQTRTLLDRKGAGRRRHCPSLTQHLHEKCSRRAQLSARLRDARLDHRVVAQHSGRAQAPAGALGLRELHEGSKARTSDAECHAGKAHAIKGEQRYVVERPALAAVVALAMRNRPPPIRMMSRQDIPMRKTVKSGAVRPMSQVRPKSMITRKMKARDKPIWRARRALFASRRAVKTEMKTRLSIPSTISSAVSVTSAAHAFASVSSDSTFI